MINIEENHYGKSCVKLAKVFKNGNVHDIKEFVVNIQLYGDFKDAYTKPCNSKVVPTDTMKNTIYVLAKQYPMNNSVEFGIDVTNYFLNKFSHISKVSVHITEVLWSRVILENNQPHTHGFVDKQTHTQKCHIVNNRRNVEARVGVDNLQILKTRGSSFENYLVDEYTTLKPARDRIMATKGIVYWTYDSSFDLKSIDHNEIFRRVKQITVETFVSHDESQSVQHTMNLVAENVLKSIKEIHNIELNFPNSHYLLSMIENFGLQNDNEIFIPAPEPYGDIHLSVSKTEYAIDRFNKLSREEAIQVVSDISTSAKLQSLLVDARPIKSFESIIESLDDLVFNKMTEQDFVNAFDSYTRLNKELSGSKLNLIDEEFKNAAKSITFDQEKIDELDRLNSEYEAKFKHMFILSVRDKSIDEVLESIKTRMNNDETTETNSCINESKKITRIRIRSVLNAYARKN